MNLFIATMMFAIIFLINLKTNLLVTSFIRGGIAFVFFFSLSWLLRWVYLTFSKNDSNIGKRIELETTQEEDQQLFEEIYNNNEQLLNEQPEFQPLEFEKIVTDNKEIEQIVKGVQSWTNDD